MRSIFRRARTLMAAAVLGVLVLSVSSLVSRALALGPNIPYMDPDQEIDAPPNAWLLMAPPTTQSGLTVDTQAGLANWITYGRYNTLKECSSTIQIVRSGVIPTSGFPPQITGNAIATNAVPIPSAMQMPAGYPSAQPGYGSAMPGAPPMPPGYPPGQPGYPPTTGAAMGQPAYPNPAYPGAPAAPPSGYPGSQPPYPGMQPGYAGMQPAYPGMQPPTYPAMLPGAPGMPPGYGQYQQPQTMIQQPAQYMTRQQADAAYCFADNDRRVQGLIGSPPATTSPGQQLLNGSLGGTGQSFSGSGR
jgi:hypothetical protein